MNTAVEPLRIFVGYDDRQTLAYTVLHYSIIKNARVPVSISPLVLDTLPITKRGLTPFTFSRFLVPYLCNYNGWAMFVDIDAIVTGDIGQLFSLVDNEKALMCVDTPLDFERASMMLFNCAHPANACLTPDFVEKTRKSLHRLQWLEGDQVGFLPGEWNHVVGIGDENPDAQLIHYTQGIPIHPQTRECEYSQEWHTLMDEASGTQTWEQLMGTSVWVGDFGDGRRGAKLDPSYQSALADARKEIAALFELPHVRAKPGKHYGSLVESYSRAHQSGIPEKSLKPANTYDGSAMVKHIEPLKKIITQQKVSSILDYGCGKAMAYERVQIKNSADNTQQNLKQFWGCDSVSLFDPALAQYEELPDQDFDLVLVVDVLQHCALEDLPWVVSEIFRQAKKFVYVAVAASASLSDVPADRSVEVSARSFVWWTEFFTEIGKRFPRVRFAVQVESVRHDNAQKTVKRMISG